MPKLPNLLIAHPCSGHRDLLKHILGSHYHILEAADGTETMQVLESCLEHVSCILINEDLDNFPGLSILETLQRRRWAELVPVIMIYDQRPTNEEAAQAFEKGASEVLSGPWRPMVLLKRIENVLDAQRFRLQERKGLQQSMPRISMEDFIHFNLNEISVEFVNLEGHQHLSNVRHFTELFLKHLQGLDPSLGLSETDIQYIAAASLFHDIGNVKLPAGLLHKNGPLCPDERLQMQQHPLIGCEMLDDLGELNLHPMIRYARQIVRWHHERYDGSGYPDHLQGDEIPIAAQVVGLVDVYDSLTTDQIWRKAYPHHKAISMIMQGACGAFHPRLLKTLRELQPVMENETMTHSRNAIHSEWRSSNSRETGTRLTARRDMPLHQLNDMRASISHLDSFEPIRFEYSPITNIIKFEESAAKVLQIDSKHHRPWEDPQILHLFGRKNWEDLQNAVFQTSSACPETVLEMELRIGRELRWFRIHIKGIWSSDSLPICYGCLGTMADIHEIYLARQTLLLQAEMDGLTQIYNAQTTRKKVMDTLHARPDTDYALLLVDADHFKEVNDTCGHLAGDEVLKHIARELSLNTRKTDIVGRLGGDEFMVLMPISEPVEPIVKRLSERCRIQVNNITVSVSMGVARTQDVGHDYHGLFEAADSALYCVKRKERGHVRYFDADLKNLMAAPSPVTDASLL